MWLFDTTNFIPREHCAINGWPTLLKLTNEISNLTIAISYLWIASWLIYFWILKKADLPRSHILCSFACFICFCGITHINDYSSFFFPAYRFFTLISFLTALVSLSTGFYLPSVISFALHMPSIETLRNANSIAQEELTKRELLEAEQTLLISNLKVSVHDLEDQLKRYLWVQDKYKSIEEIKRLLTEAGQG